MLLDVIVIIVTMSVSPINGDSPESLSKWKFKWKKFVIRWWSSNSQNVTYNSDGPHVSVISYRIKINDFWSDKFWSTEKNLQFFVRIIPSGHSKVNDFDSIAGFR